MNKDALDYYNSFSQDVKEFCSPLDRYFGISLFVYFKVYKNGQYTLITNDSELNTYYLNNVSFANVFFRNYMDHKNKYICILWPFTPQNFCMQAYFNFNHWHGISFIMDNKCNKLEICAFAAKKDNPGIIDLYYKYSPILENFVDHFKLVFTKKIDIPALDKRLATFKKVDMHIPERNLIKEQQAVQSIYNELGINQKKSESINFTISELKILKFVCLGFTAKHIATELGISNRTVETHLHNIKQKSGYHYKNDLIKMYQDLF